MSDSLNPLTCVSKAYHIDPDHVVGVFQANPEEYTVLLAVGSTPMMVRIDAESGRRLMDSCDENTEFRKNMMQHVKDFNDDDD